MCIVRQKGKTMHTNRTKAELQEWVSNWYDTLAKWQHTVRNGR